MKKYTVNNEELTIQEIKGKILENLDDNIIHVFPDVSGEVKLKYQILNEDLNLLGDQSSSLVNPNSDSPQFYNSFSLVDTDNGTFLAYSEQVYFAAFNVFLQKFDVCQNITNMHRKYKISFASLPAVTRLTVYRRLQVFDK